MSQATTNQAPVLLTIRQACGTLAIGRTKLYELIQGGQLRAVRIGERGIRVPQSEVDRFVSKQLEGTA
jgi:excisionase family DNA binding protein